MIMYLTLVVNAFCSRRSWNRAVGFLTERHKFDAVAIYFVLLQTIPSTLHPYAEVYSHLQTAEFRIYYI